MESKEPLILLASELGLSETHPDPAQLRESIERRISELISTDINRLILLLYRLDVNEKKLTAALEENTGSDTAAVITSLVIERQMQKAVSKKTDHGFRRDENISEDDKW
jgi:hypothetical protein